VATGLPLASWAWPPVFHWLQEQGRITTAEMLRTFNCGIGMIVVLPTDGVESARRLLAGSGIAARVIGEVIAGDGTPATHYVGEPAR